MVWKILSILVSTFTFGEQLPMIYLLKFIGYIGWILAVGIIIWNMILGLITDY